MLRTRVRVGNATGRQVLWGGEHKSILSYTERDMPVEAGGESFQQAVGPENLRFLANGDHIYGRQERAEDRCNSFTGYKGGGVAQEESGSHEEGGHVEREPFYMCISYQGTGSVSVWEL